jgi:hypothetical protein
MEGCLSTDYVSDLSPLVERAKGIKEWLTEVRPSCFTEQQHLTEGTEERAYWHYGYMVALNDALRILTGEAPLNQAPGNQQWDTRNSYPRASLDE